MKPLLTFALSLWMVLTVAANPLILLSGGVTAGGGGITYLLDEGAEGVGVPAGWTDTGTVNWDYTTTPAPLVGSESLRFGASSSASSSYLFTGQTSVEGYCQFSVDILPSSTGTIVGFRDAASNPLALVRMNASGNISIFLSGGDTFTTDAAPAATKIHLWWTFNSAGTCTVEWSLNGVRVGSGTKFASNTGPSGTAARYQPGVIGTRAVIFDRMLVSTSAIPSNP